MQEAVLRQLARLYFDTVIAGTAASIGPVLGLKESDRIIFGTDFPPPRESVIEQNIAALGTLNYMSEVEKAAISLNERRVVPRCAVELP